MPVPASSVSAGPSPVPLDSSPPTMTARPAGVLRSNTSRTVNTAPAARARATSCIEMIESPPRSKKESSGPTRCTPSTSANSEQMTSSALVADARPPAVPVNSGAGRAARSTLPLGVSWNWSRMTMAAGTM